MSLTLALLNHLVAWFLNSLATFVTWFATALALWVSTLRRDLEFSLSLYYVVIKATVLCLTRGYFESQSMWGDTQDNEIGCS